MNKSDMIDAITVKVDALLDMRGTEKCRTALEIVNMLAALKSGMEADEAAKNREIENLRERLAEAVPRDGCDGDTETIDGVTYQVGVIGGGRDKK